MTPAAGAGVDAAFLGTLTDSSLYSIGAFFCDRHPELVDEVLAQGAAMEHDGLETWASNEGEPLEAAFQTLVTSLAIRYFKAVAGPA